ncbi:hypothetical protein RN001_009390 [Aquatica leii]|uniref:DDE Tnp4 domain-containing protein n=1 Tax=Aquatica leii TaxID=1421715 RepID=A0AAN7SFL8_9COLE|nr:hypothetical protein RN001_009390 [Aquatica leii]
MNKIQKASVAIILACATKHTVKRKRWVKNWLKKRVEYSHLVLLKEILEADAADYKNYFRMSATTFNKLLSMVKPFIQRQNSNTRECITAEERLAVTLRYLATGRYFEDLKFSAIISPSAISKAVIETCEVLVYVLQDYIKTNIAHGFENIYNFYNTVGALDGKHIAIKKPVCFGLMYYNYKGFYSIVLLALVNANKEFIMIDAGMNGKVSDGGVFFYSKLGSLIENEAFNQLLPQSSTLPNTDELFPYIVIADEAFALHKHVMKPYSQRGLTSDKE